MQLLSEDQAREWCETRGMDVQTGCPFAIRFRDAGAPSVRIAAPREGLGILSLTALLLAPWAAGPAEEAFPGGLVWLRDWDIWSEATERVGHALLRGVRAPHPRAGDVAGLPAHRLDAAEGTEARALLTLPLLFQWDAWLVPESADLAVFLSHDGFVRITAASPGAHDRVMECVRDGGWTILP